MPAVGAREVRRILESAAQCDLRDRERGHRWLDQQLTRTLEPGFVVTIEPGLYFIDQLLDKARTSPLGKQIDWQQVERFKPYGGVRIEDDVVCMTGAPENLTRPAFAEAN